MAELVTSIAASHEVWYGLPMLAMCGYIAWKMARFVSRVETMAENHEQLAKKSLDRDDKLEAQLGDVKDEVHTLRVTLEAKSIIP